MNTPTIGIDLGTTYSVVAALDPGGQATIIPNHLGQRLTPSVVDLRAQTVGADAKSRAQDGDDDAIIAFFKRDMGNPNALYIHEGRHYSPVDLSALVLRYLKTCAEHYLKADVRQAVITVPAYFNNAQREATIKAGQQAGLTVLRIINEPTAAALAFGVRPGVGAGYALVYDLGGGTFDVSLVGIEPGLLRVIGTAGDHDLGGKNWDDRLLTHIASRFEDEHGLDLFKDDLNPLLVMAEQSKISLSQRERITVTVQSQGRSGSYPLSRAQFEDLTRDLIERTLGLTEQVLSEAGGTWADVDGVVLVGGSTRMPMVREALEKRSGHAPLAGVHPDEAVALGAAIQAAQDSSNTTLLLGGRMHTKDVISNSLGMIAENEDRSAYINSIIIAKNQAIPATHTRPYQLRVSGRREQNRLEVFMTQGESTNPQDLTYLGKYVFSGIPALQGRVAVIDISYAYNVNGVVEVSAVERSTQQPLRLQIEAVPDDVPARFLQKPEDLRVHEHVTAYLALDVSGSMMGKPLEEAKKAAYGFVAEMDLSLSSVGIIQWSDRERIVTPASQNAKQIRAGIEGLRSAGTGFGTSGNPFATILQVLGRSTGKRYGVVLTDGALYRKREAIEAADACRRAGIEIIAIGFGMADRAFLNRVSSSDQHSFFVDMNQLSLTFSTIAQEITEGGGDLDVEALRERRRGLQLL